MRVGNVDIMSSDEPLKPFVHTGSQEIDAADPGRGAPGVDPEPAEADTTRAERDFADRMTQERQEKPLFRTPVPGPDTGR